MRSASVRDRRRHWFHAAWFGSAALTALLAGTGYEHHYAALAPGAALLTAPLLDRRRTAGLIPAVLLLTAMIHFLGLPDRYRDAWNDRHAIARFAGAIAPHVQAADKCLFVFHGPTSLYRLTGGCAPTRLVDLERLADAAEAEALGVSQSGEVARILAASPSVIVTSDTPRQAQDLRSLRLVNDAVRRDYVPIATASVGDRVLRAWSSTPVAEAACRQGADSCGRLTRPIYHK